MKTTRRHELQTNQLAESLARWIDAVKPYSRMVLAGFVALVTLLIAWGFMAEQASRRAEDGWQEYFVALTERDPSDALKVTAEQYAGLPVSEWSRLVLADIQLDNGTNRLFTDKKEARNDLRAAAEKYRSVLVDSRQPMISQHATFGLARAHEALGLLEDAGKDYRSLVKQWPDSPYAATAERRAKELEQTSTKEFYDWFAKYEPPRSLTNQPGMPGARPDFLKDTLDEGGPQIPSVIDGKAPPSGAPAGSAAPSGEEAKPDLDLPGAEPGADQPAASEPPAGENAPANPAATEPK